MAGNHFCATIAPVAGAGEEAGQQSSRADSIVERINPLVGDDSAVIGLNVLLMKSGGWVSL